MTSFMVESVGINLNMIKNKQLPLLLLLLLLQPYKDDFITLQFEIKIAAHQVASFRLTKLEYLKKNSALVIHPIR